MKHLPPPAQEFAEGMENFISHLKAEAAKSPARETLTIEEARAVAERARHRFVQGGPVMAKVENIQIQTRHGEVSVRIYTPAKQRTPGLFVYVHGGGWVLFSNDTHDRVMREYADRIGMRVAGVDYTRAPDGKYPRQIEEIIDVLNHFYGSTADPIALGGDSAGGNLSLAAAMCLRDAGKNYLKALLLNYGCFDADLIYESCVRYGAGNHVTHPLMLIWFLYHYLPLGADIRDPLISPLRGNLKNLPPAFVAIADLDILRDQNLLMVDALERSGVKTDSKIYSGTVHGFLEATSVAPVAVEAIQETSDWVRAVMVR